MRREICIRALMCAITISAVALIAGCGAVNAVMTTVTYTVNVSGYDGGSISEATVQYTLPDSTTKTVTPTSFPLEVTQAGYISGLPIALRVYGTSSGGMMTISLRATSRNPEGVSTTLVNYTDDRATGVFDEARASFVP